MGFVICSRVALIVASVLILQVFTGLPLGVHAQSSAGTTTYKAYQNPNMGVSVQYPAGWTFTETTQGSRQATAFAPYQGSATVVQLFFDRTTSYVGTDQQKLDRLPQIIQRVCSEATIAQFGFSCSNFQYKTGVGNYSGIPSYVMLSSMTETFSDGSSREQDMAQFLVIVQGSDYGVLVSCPKVECDTYTEQLDNFVKTLSISSVPQAAATPPQQAYSIPSWVKNQAKWWAEGQLADSEFIKGIEYLVQQGIIIIPSTPVSSQQGQGIPSWVKNNAKWWAEGQLGDAEFVKGIQYLVETGIITTQSGSPAPAGILEGATFYTGPTGQPVAMNYTDKDGVSLSVTAVPGIALVYVSQGTDPALVNQTVSSLGGVVISQIPKMGYYEIQVEDVPGFVSKMLQQTFVLYASPDAVFVPSQAQQGLANFFDLGNYRTGADINAGAKNPNPHSKVIVAVIDDFNGCYVLKTGSHGCQVLDEMRQKNPDLAVMALQFSGDPNTFQKDVAAAIATAEANDQKLVINLSWGPPLADDNGVPLPGAQEAYAQYLRFALSAINTDYAKKGNIAFVQSGGNDNMDVSEAINKVKADSQLGGLFQKNYVVSGQLDQKTQQPMKYANNHGSNTGTDILYSDPTTKSCPTGTSCTAPNIAAAMATIWQAKPDASATDIKTGVASTAKAVNGYPVLSPQDAYNAVTKCLPMCTPINYKTGTGAPVPNQLAQQGNQPPGFPGVITPIGNMSGTYAGAFSMTDTSSDGCTFTGQFKAVVVQQGTSLSGVLTLFNGYSPQVSDNPDCTLDDMDFQFQNGVVSSSAFKFTSNSQQGMSVTGSFTSSLIRGTFQECGDGSCATGKFAGSRQ